MIDKAMADSMRAGSLGSAGGVGTGKKGICADLKVYIWLVLKHFSLQSSGSSALESTKPENVEAKT